MGKLTTGCYSLSTSQITDFEALHRKTAGARSSATIILEYALSQRDLSDEKGPFWSSSSLTWLLPINILGDPSTKTWLYDNRSPFTFYQAQSLNRWRPESQTTPCFLQGSHPIQRSIGQIAEVEHGMGKDPHCIPSSCYSFDLVFNPALHGPWAMDL